METIHIDQWQSAFAMAQYKNNIKPPPLLEISKIKQKDIVKICNGYEYVWVEIVSKKMDKECRMSRIKFIGRIINDLVCRASYKKGDLVSFESKNVHDLHIYMCEKLKKNN